MHANPPHEHLPPGWDEEMWNVGVRRLCQIIRHYGGMGTSRTYKQLTDEAELPGIGYHSIYLTPLLNEIATEERRKGANCWVTAFVVLSGEEFSSDGLFKLIGYNDWTRGQRRDFCREQRTLAQVWIQEHSDI